MKNILLDSGTRNLKNLGDIAMLQVTVNRIHAMFPRARIAVLTDDPESLMIHLPSVIPVDAKGLSQRFEPWNLIGPLRHFSRLIGHRYLEQFEELIWSVLPNLACRFAAKRFKVRNIEPLPLIELKNEIQKADMVALSGGGYIADDFFIESRQRLMLLQWARAMGIRTAMWGQGLGPITNPSLLYIAGNVLKRVNLLAVRERIVSVSLAQDLGVSSDKIVFTGDDAVALAERKNLDCPANVLGFNIRVASYSGIGLKAITQIDQLIEDFCSEKNIDIRLIIISTNLNSNDYEAAQSLLNISKRVKNQEPQSSTADLASQVASCRVMFTGSYHGAVFALASGTPVVCIASSDYYENKFRGLQIEYGRGCVVVRIDKQPLSDVSLALTDLWTHADTMNESLHGVADKQVKLSQQAYKRALTTT